MDDASPTASTPPTLAELLSAQRERFGRGEGVPVEDYLRGRPDLAGQESAVLDLIAQEYLCRKGAGEAVGIDDFVRRFPALARPLRIQLALLDEVGMAAHATGPGPAPGAECGTSLPAPPGYRLLGVIGRGAMGTVYRAWEESIGRLVALKMLRGSGADALARFRQEAEAVGRMQHPHIVQIFAVGTHEGHPFLVLEYVAGGSLDRRLAGTPLSPARAARLVEPLARAVHHAHQCGVIHRDLKPGNILLTSPTAPDPADEPTVTTGADSFAKSPPNQDAEWVAKVADFGLAKRLQGDGGMTATHVVMGTPSYMPPEQAVGASKQVGPTADVYSLGAILYECLTGRPPFRAATLEQTLWQVCHDDPVSPRQLQPTTPRDLETICLKCLAKEPARRYATAHDLAEDLRRLQSGAPIVARPAGRVERAWRWCRRRPAAAGLAASIAALVLVGLAAAFWYVDDRAQLRAEEERGQALTEQGVSLALQAARKQRAELLGTLGERGGVFTLLNQPHRWRTRIGMARASVDHAKALAARAPRELDAGLQNDLRDLEHALDRDEADLRRALRLDKARFALSTPADGIFDYACAFREYVAAFDIPAPSPDPRGLADSIRSSPIKELLVAALDDWALVAGMLPDKHETWMEPLLAVARAADPDPEFADRLRRREVLTNVDALAKLVQGAPMERMSPQQLLLVGVRLRDHPLREPWTRRARALHPDDFWLNALLTSILCRTAPGDAIGFARVAVALRPESSVSLWELGVALHGSKKDLAEALAVVKKAVDIDPQFYKPYGTLGRIYVDLRRYSEADAAFRRCIELHKDATIYTHLAESLRTQKRFPEALATYREALAIDPTEPTVCNNLGVLLREQGQPREGIKILERARDPGNPASRARISFNLGWCYSDIHAHEAAVRHYRKTLSVNPDHAECRVALGWSLYLMDRFDEAILHFREALRVAPKYAMAHNNLGLTYYRQGKLQQALEHLETARKLSPTFPSPSHNLAKVYRDQGRFAEALEACQRAESLGEAVGGLREDLSRLLKQEHQIRDILNGKQTLATAPDGVQLAEFCRRYKRWYAAAVSLYDVAFALKPEWADDLEWGRRFRAALLAVQAAHGLGDDAPAMADRAKLRGRAMSWLRADLTLYAKGLAQGPSAEAARRVVAAAHNLQQWQREAALAPVRDESELPRLPRDEERAWRALWAEAADHLRSARARLVSTQLAGQLSEKAIHGIHRLEVEAGEINVIEMDSGELDTLLRVEDDTGKVLAENDDISPDQRNSRLVFVAPRGGVFRIVATSFEGRGRGTYTLTIHKAGRPMDDTEFQELIRLVRLGDEQAAQTLVRDYEPYVRRAVRLQLRDPRVRRVFDSMDVCQAVMASFFTRACEGRFDLRTPAQLVNLLMAMARNKAGKQVRAERTEGRDVTRLAAEPVEDHDQGSSTTPSVVCSVHELVARARAQMAAGDWRLLELRNEGHDWAEIAARCGGTPEALRKRLERALVAVRQQLAVEE